METQIALIQNREMARRTAAEMKNTLFHVHGGETADTESLMPDDIQKSVRVTNPPGTRLLTITAEANNPGQARGLANTTANAFITYKEYLAAEDMSCVRGNLEREAARAALAMDQAERRERLSRQGASPPPDSAARLRQNTEIATEVYRRLQTALSAARLQHYSASENVMITQSAETLTAPSSP